MNTNTKVLKGLNDSGTENMTMHHVKTKLNGQGIF